MRVEKRAQIPTSYLVTSETKGTKTTRSDRINPSGVYFHQILQF
jgi:hypothetical protein